jgi:predicted SAM-dependent methyltransferase
MKKGLNIGCGPVILQSDQFVEWENSDFADTESSKGWKIDKKRDFTQAMTDIEDNSIDYIVAWHIIEHVGLHENSGLVKEWLRVLKPGGKLYIACPDLTRIAQHIVNRDGPWQDWFICMVNVFGPYNGYVGDYHKWGYDAQSLALLLAENGYTRSLGLSPASLAVEIGPDNAQKIGFADYNVQLEAVK